MNQLAISFSFFSARTVTLTDAGRALIVIGSLVNGLMPCLAFRAGTLRVVIFSRPGNTNSPQPRLFTCRSMMLTRLSNTSLTCFLPRAVPTAISLTIWNLEYRSFTGVVVFLAATGLAATAFLAGAFLAAAFLVGAFLTAFFVWWRLSWRRLFWPGLFSWRVLFSWLSCS